MKKCKYLKTDNGGGDSMTWWYVCKKQGKPIDIEECDGCEIVEGKADENSDA